MHDAQQLRAREYREYIEARSADSRTGRWEARGPVHIYGRICSFPAINMGVPGRALTFWKYLHTSLLEGTRVWANGHAFPAWHWPSR